MEDNILNKSIPLKDGVVLTVTALFFRLKHPAGSSAEKDFLAEASKLASLPGVGNFRCVKQVGKKNDFTHGLLMDFEDDAV